MTLLLLTLPIPAQAFSIKKILLAPVKVVTYPFKVVKDIVYEVAVSVYLDKVL